MNIMLVSSSNYKENGAARSLINLARYALDAGHHVVVLLTKRGSLEVELQAQGIPCRIVKHLDKWCVPVDSAYPSGVVQHIKRVVRICYDRIFADAQIRRILDENRIDIVHINAIATGVAARAAIRKKKKLVWHLREFMGEDLRFVDPESAFRLVSRADCAIAISDAIQREYAGSVHARMVKIFNGVDAQRFYASRRILGSETVKIVISGRIMPIKGQLTLLKAVRIVKGAGLGPFECHILGPTRDKQYLGQLMEYASANGLERCVYFDGPSDSVPQRLREMDILCLCSTREAFGLSTVEGMLSGCLVIGTSAGGTVEILEDGVTGLLYEPGGGENALAERLIWAMRNPEKAREIALRGQEHALNHHSMEGAERQTLQLYEELLGR